MSFEDYVDEDLYQPSQAELGDTRPIVQSVSRDEKEFLTNLMAGALMAGHKEAKSIPGIRPTKEVTVSDDEIIEQADVWLRQIGLTYDGLTSLMTQSDAQDGHDWAWELTRKPEAQWNAGSILKTANPFNTAMDVITGKPGATQESIKQHGVNPYSDGTDYMGGALAGLDALDIASLWPMYKGPMWVLKNLMARMAPRRTVARRGSDDLSRVLTHKYLRPKGMHSGIGSADSNTFPPYNKTHSRHPQEIEADMNKLSPSERDQYLSIMDDGEYNDYMAWQREAKFKLEEELGQPNPKDYSTLEEYENAMREWDLPENRAERSQPFNDPDFVDPYGEGYDWRQGPESVDEERAVSDLGDELYEQFNPANQFPNPNRMNDISRRNLENTQQYKPTVDEFGNEIDIPRGPYPMEYDSDAFNPWINFTNEVHGTTPEWKSWQNNLRGYSPTGEYIDGVGFITRDQYGNVGPPYPWTRPLPDQIDINNLQATVFDVLDEFNVQYNKGALGQVLEKGGVEGLVESLLKQPHIEMMFPGKLRDILKLSDKEFSPFIKWLAAASLIAAPLGVRDVASNKAGPNQEDTSGTVFEGLDESSMLQRMMEDAGKQGHRMSILMGRTSKEMLDPVWDALVSAYGEDFAKEIMDPPSETNPLVTGNAIILSYPTEEAEAWVAKNGAQYGFFQNSERPSEVTFGQRKTPQVGNFGDVLSTVLNNQQPIIQEPVEFQDSFEVLQNRGQLSSSERAIWANQFLQGIDAPITADNLDTVVTWIHNENGHSFNPINTTWGKSHDEWPVINESGVKAYPDWNTGLRASVATIQESQYSEMLDALKRGTTSLEFGGLLMPTSWGTNHFFNHPDTYDYVELFNE